MKRWALTGGVACGKSTAAGFFSEAGIPVWEADVAAHAMMAPGRPVHAQVVGSFGTEILNPDGTIDRRKLGRKVFFDRAALQELNRLVHPAVAKEMSEWFRLLPPAVPAALAVIPLLFEAGMEKGWDAVIAVACPAAFQRRWLLARGMTEEEGRARVAAQWPAAEKMARADVVLFNGGSLSCLKSQVAYFLNQAGVQI